MQLADEQVATAGVKAWQGLHLLHFSESSCSQKVRILLREKGLRWQSHPVDLARQRHVTPWFLGINPRGVVPVLVHDGVVHVESNDIMQYLDECVPSQAPRLMPQTDEERREARESLALEDGLHMELRTITMGFLVPAALARKSPQTLTAYAEQGAADAKREREVAWWRRFGEVGVTDDAARCAAAAFAGLDERLAGKSWLLGDRISVLEIAWFISIHRLAMAGYPLARHARLLAHYQRLLTRPAFAAEVDSRSLPRFMARAYTAYRSARHTTLGDLLAAG